MTVIWFGKKDDIPNNINGFVTIDKEEFFNKLNTEKNKNENTVCVLDMDKINDMNYDNKSIIKNIMEHKRSPNLILVSSDLSLLDNNFVFHFVEKDYDKYEEILEGKIDRLKNEKDNINYILPEDEEKRLEKVDKLNISEHKSEIKQLLDNFSSKLEPSDSCLMGVVDKNKEIIISNNFKEGEIDRKKTVCTFTILNDSIYEIEDVGEDPRFKQLESCFDTIGVKSYVGIPIEYENRNVGTLCVINKNKKRYTDKDKDIIRSIKDKIESELKKGK